MVMWNNNILSSLWKISFSHFIIEEFTNSILKNTFEQGKEYTNLNKSSQDLINKLLTLNSKFRISAEDALNHQFFEKGNDDFSF